MENTKRIHLLSSTEVEELYARPEFNTHEQRLYFTLNQSERTALAQFSNTKTQIYFILQTGYFKAKQQFFNFSLDEVSNDVQFIVRTYYSESASMSFTGRISRDYVRIQRQTLLSLFGYRNWTSDFALETQTHIGGLLRYFRKSHSAFRQLLAYFDHQKIIIPSYTFPLFDLLALSGVQLKMLHSLAKLYEVPFSKNLGKSSIVSLLGGVMPTSTAMTLASLAKAVPGLGTATGVISVSLLGGATTYAIGSVFMQHFESGGTLLDFDAKKMRAYFSSKLEEGKGVVADLKPSETQTSGS